MLQRLSLHFLLIFLFAFTQIGAATHEISHYSDAVKQHQQDKNTPAEQCEQCVAYAQLASGLQSQPFVLPFFDGHFASAAYYFFNDSTSPLTAYAARAPPQTFNI